jgi:hypothetical protein
MTSQVIERSRRAAQTARTSTFPDNPAMPRLLLILVLVAFSALTALALWQHGLRGIFEPLFASSAGLQVFVDLVIALSLFLVWMWHDAHRTGRNPWPWIVLTLLSGSFGPLLYLLSRPANPPAR